MSMTEGDLKDGPRTGQGKAPIQFNTILRLFFDERPFLSRIISLRNQTPFRYSCRGLQTQLRGPVRLGNTYDYLGIRRSSRCHRKHHQEISDDELELAAPIAVLEVVEVKDDYDDVEYMAPNTLDIPYQPAFDSELPYTLGASQTLMEFSRNLALEELQLLTEISLRPKDIEQVYRDIMPLLEPASYLAYTYKRNVSAAPRSGSVKVTSTGLTRLSQRPVTAQITSKSEFEDVDLIPFKVDATEDSRCDFLFNV
ncbi:hypothetical protein AAF712_002945 [Marasmius tenuissimus]|uniref:Uncharacterized protein n=1 Tax=Marasmius tenuissimus TaxID=585030 RepID=A0ABR3A8M5_9AGAR